MTIEREQEYVVSEIRVGGGFTQPIRVHASNPLGRSIDFTLDHEDYEKHALLLGQIVKVTIRYD